MKKLLSLVLVMMLLTVPALAISIGDYLGDLLGGTDSGTSSIQLAVLEDKAIGFESQLWGYTATYSALVESKEANEVWFFNAQLEGKDKDGQVLYTGSAYSVTPNYLRPGQVALVTAANLQITKEQYDAITAWELKPSGYAVGKDEVSAFAELPVTAELTLPTADDPFASFSNGEIIANITNNTADTAYDVNVYHLLKDKDGKLIAGIIDGAYNIGIPAGGSIYLNSTVTVDHISAAKASGQEISSVESKAYVVVHGD